MSLMSIFLLIVFTMILSFIGIAKLLNTSAGRIFLINLKMSQEEKIRKKEINDYQKLTLEQAKNPDEFLELILKMKMGERVDIPLAAFSYIYKNLDTFTIFDKDGNLTILNRDKYFEFKRKASSLIEENTDRGNKDKISNIIKEEKEKIATSPIEIIEHEDGTLIKKDYVARTIEIKKSNDEKILINMDDDSVVLENIENVKIDAQNKSIDKKEYAKKEQKREQNEKEMKQKLKLLEHEKNEKEEELAKEKKKNLNNNNKELDAAIQEVQNIEKKQSAELKQDKEKEHNLDKIDEARSVEKSNINKKEILNTKIKEKKKNEVKEEKNITQFKLTFDNNLMHFCQQIKHTTVEDIIHFIALCDINVCRKFVVYDANVDCILINTNWFIYRISLLIENENERETFLNKIFTDKKKAFIDNDFLSKIIEKINYAGSYKFGAIIFSQEKKDKKIINFKSAKILDKKTDKLYQGTFLYMLMRNEIFKNNLNKDKKLDKIVSSEFCVELSDNSATKINYEDVIM